MHRAKKQSYIFLTARAGMFGRIVEYKESPIYRRTTLRTLAAQSAGVQASMTKANFFYVSDTEGGVRPRGSRYFLFWQDPLRSVSA